MVPLGLPALSEFNRAVNFHCLRLPIWFASLRLDSDNGALDDGYVDNGTRDEGHLNGVVAAIPKKVLILMTDTAAATGLQLRRLRRLSMRNLGMSIRSVVVAWSGD